MCLAKGHSFYFLINFNDGKWYMKNNLKIRTARNSLGFCVTAWQEEKPELKLHSRSLLLAFEKVVT